MIFHRPKTFTALAALLTGLALPLVAGGAPGVPPIRPPVRPPLPPVRADDLLPRENIVLPSALQVDLLHRTVRLPLHRGSFAGRTVWFVLTDCSDETLARTLGLNFAPKLANIPRNAPAAFQSLNVPANLLSAPTVEFAGVPDFSPTRRVVPGPLGFPLQAAEPGAIAGPGYSPYVQPVGTNVVYNAPIVAVGDGPFDFYTHTDTHDRLIDINTEKGTADLLFIQAFCAGKQVMYLGMDATTPEAAALERATFTPGISESSFPNGAFRTDAARATIFSFANGQRGLDTLNSQGLNHLVLDGLITKDATPASYDVFDALARGGDARNTIEVFPTMTDPKFSREYSPAWDFHLSVWQQGLVDSGANVAQADAFTIRTRGERFDITSPGGLHLAAAGIEVNCPVFAFLTEPPLAPVVPAPVALPLPYRQ